MEVNGGREMEDVRGASFTIGFDIDKITQIVWLRLFMEKIVSNGSDFLLCVFFDLEPMKRFYCGSDV